MAARPAAIAPDERDVVIAGGGLAGAATAFFLSRERGLRVTLLEREREPGRHSSGRSAGLVRRASGDPRLDALCDEGAAFYAAPPDDFPGEISFRRTGSFLLVPEASVATWLRDRMRVASLDEVTRAVPPFEPAPGTIAIHGPDDGVVEPKAVLAGFLERACARGLELRLGEPALSIESRDGRWLVTTARGVLRARVVVDAAGAWARALAAADGLPAPELVPYRRHLLTTVPDARVDPRWPWIWDESRDFYFRPESGGLLGCACDESPDVPADCEPDPRVEALIREKARACVPAFASLPTERLWAGHRTRTADGGFVVGADRRREGFVWAAGLGGHGVTTAPAVGRIAAGAVRRELARTGLEMEESGDGR